MASEWDEHLRALGLEPPPEDGAGAEAPSFGVPGTEVLPPGAPNPLGALAGHAAQGLANFVATPGRLTSAANPYPPGSEQADYFERSREAAGQDWAGSTALGMLGGGTGFVRGAPGEVALGAAGAKPSYLSDFEKKLAQPDPSAAWADALAAHKEKFPLTIEEQVKAATKAASENAGTSLLSDKIISAEPYTKEYWDQIQAKVKKELEQAGLKFENEPSLSDSAISAKLAENPGASIFDLAGHNELMPKVEVYKRTPQDYSEHLKPIEDWNALTSAHGPASFEDIGTRERARQVGFNTDLPLFKGGHLADYPEALSDPMSKESEHGTFFSPERRIAKGYTSEDAQPLEYVARANRPVEVDWKGATGLSHYSPEHMDDLIRSARSKNADMLVVRNIGDIGGRQDQYVALDPSIIRRPDAAFNPSALHLNRLAAGLAGGAITSPFVFDEKNNPYILTK